jgi:hypothetical protein
MEAMYHSSKSAFNEALSSKARLEAIQSKVQIKVKAAFIAMLKSLVEANRVALLKLNEKVLSCNNRHYVYIRTHGFPPTSDFSQEWIPCE